MVAFGPQPVIGPLVCPATTLGLPMTILTVLPKCQPPTQVPDSSLRTRASAWAMGTAMGLSSAVIAWAWLSVG